MIASRYAPLKQNDPALVKNVGSLCFQEGENDVGLKIQFDSHADGARRAC
jgi:hypothetical protein